MKSYSNGKLYDLGSICNLFGVMNPESLFLKLKHGMDWTVNNGKPMLTANGVDELVFILAGHDLLLNMEMHQRILENEERV